MSLTLDEAKEKFIKTWGAQGSNWGINKTMAQIHALLMTSIEPLSTDDIMEQLAISRGNVNMNMRVLLDWGLAYKEIIPGERKEFFIGSKDILHISRRIIEERRKREIEPLNRLLKEVGEINDKKADAKDKEEFEKLIKEIQEFSGKMQRLSEKYVSSDEKWFMKVLMKII